MPNFPILFIMAQVIIIYTCNNKNQNDLKTTAVNNNTSLKLWSTLIQGAKLCFEILPLMNNGFFEVLVFVKVGVER